ncbi:Neuronal acetylcholine receptor subunit alpha-6 [Seminavis robusta]|uniref:Neuronal acetylcholine receptor subunit alpha-6 n=1 Tax=Seminavis robusta TaxID=568900 RepID=A0A9N8HMG6_9STRA|nr:Neuronal acetylcholine receptor subunit alpha-6 [Seminavis robusta]|eukprot:Sro743_g196060.1 Neuronal acetylcholine receptor subunit alpha-6 (488) ;mRNA; r:19954-21417
MLKGFVYALVLLSSSIQRAAGQTNVTSTSGAVGNCLCEGRGDLIGDYVIQVDRLPNTFSFLVDEDLQGNPSCGSIQERYATSTECDEVLWATEFCCTGGPRQDQCAQQVRSQILGGYDKITIPSTSLITDPVKVTVEMTYHTITDISETRGIIQIFVSLTLKWNDPRLSWDFDPDGACTSLPVNVRAQMQQGLKDSEIWVPEFDLYNQIKGVAGMTGPLAAIERDGTVTWARIGSLQAICQMANLGQIPYDSLECQLLMGSRSIGVDYELAPSGGLVTSGYDGPYNGYRVVKLEPGVFIGANNDTVLFYNFEISRGTSYYVQNVIVPIIIFSYCSILTMVVGVGAFQTLALNFTLLLVSVTQKVAVSRLLPITNEALWIVDFVFGSFYFIVITLIETFFKFIILEIRKTRQAAREQLSEENPQAEESPKSILPEFFFTFSMRRMDVICCWASFLAYTIYVIVFFAARDSWGNDVTVVHVLNNTDQEL